MNGLKGLQDHFRTFGGMEQVPDILHYGDVFTVTDASGKYEDRDLAASRMRGFHGTHRISV